MRPARKEGAGWKRRVLYGQFGRVWRSRAHAVAYQAARSWRPKQPFLSQTRPEGDNQDHRRKVGVQSHTPCLPNQLSTCPNRRPSTDPQGTQRSGTRRTAAHLSIESDGTRVSIASGRLHPRHTQSFEGFIIVKPPSNLLHHPTAHLGSLSATCGGLEWLLRSAVPSSGYRLWQATFCLSPPAGGTSLLISTQSRRDSPNDMARQFDSSYSLVWYQRAGDAGAFLHPELGQPCQ